MGKGTQNAESSLFHFEHKEWLGTAPGMLEKLRHAFKSKLVCHLNGKM